MVSFPRGSVRGAIAVPGDKSISHRALVIQAFAGGAFSIENLNPGGDVLATQQALLALDASFDKLRMTIPSGRSPERGAPAPKPRGRMTPEGRQDDTERRQEEACEVDCMNSGSTARMLLGVCAGANIRARFDGDTSLRRRPMEPVAAQLRAFGARIETTEGGLPLEIFGCERIQTRRFILLSPSAQVKSALLFAALFAGAQIDITGDAGSRDHTERLLRYQGAQISWNGKSVDFVAPPARFKDVSVAGDFSAAAFFMTAATIAPGSELTIRGVGVNPTRTGLLDALRLMGAEIELRDERELSG